MVTISLCMIVKNEEMHIARCLDSVAELVDEIIIIDTGSTDRTVKSCQTIRQRSFHSNGMMTLLMLGMTPFPEHLWTIVCGWMLMIS